MRVGEAVRHAIADILANGDVHDPDLEGHIITVPEVRMSPDLKLATVYVMPLGGRDTELVMAALERNMPKELREALVKVREHVEKNCEHVGDKFAEEARKIHYGESDKRGIYGETTEEEAEALTEEGIEFGRLPWVPRGN